MKSIGVVLIVLSCHHFIQAQEFVEIKEGLPFPAVSTTSLTYVDVDGDIDEDLVLLGWDSDDWYTKLFINDGDGNFVEDVEVPFEQVQNGGIAAADIDNDGDQDLIICGNDEFWKVKTNLYINQGN